MSDCPLAVIRDPRFREHEVPPGHPERPARVSAIDQALDKLEREPLGLTPRMATEEEILRTHDATHLAQLQNARGKTIQFDADTASGPNSVDTALLAAGSTVELALRVARGEFKRGFAIVRPPGHHAERSAPMGFCLLNQVAMAAHALQAELGLERIAVVDFDVHHGNGTQHIFESDRDVLFLSTHQFPFYPGTGALAEQGREGGLGATVNLPLPAGSGDAEYRFAFEAVGLPVLREFRPELILVSAGFDAHAADPLGGMRLSTEGFRWIARALREIADDCCQGRLVLSLEGGYDLDGLSRSVAAVVEVLSGAGQRHVFESVQLTPGLLNTESFLQAHAPYWGLIRAASG